MSKSCSPLSAQSNAYYKHISAMSTSFISIIFYYNSQNSLFVSFLSDYNTGFYRNYKNNTSHEPH